MKEFWKEVPLIFKVIWSLMLGLGMIVIGLLIWAIIKLVLYYT